jgi:hypothetical protein
VKLVTLASVKSPSNLQGGWVGKENLFSQASQLAKLFELGLNETISVTI